MLELTFGFNGTYIDCIVSLIVYSYRDLLDQFELFNTRAVFDVNRRKVDVPIPPQIFVKCTFCSQSIQPKRVSNAISIATLKPKIGSCPSCSASLPRCSLCMLHLGSHFDAAAGHSSNFDRWFAWCQSCHHGGHAQHLFEWFQSNERCPVANCGCSCFL